MFDMQCLARDAMFYSNMISKVVLRPQLTYMNFPSVPMIRTHEKKIPLF